MPKEKPDANIQFTNYQGLERIETGSNRSYQMLIKPEKDQLDEVNQYDYIKDDVKSSIRYSTEPKRGDNEPVYMELESDHWEFVKDEAIVKETSKTDYVPVYLELCPDCWVENPVYESKENTKSTLGYIVSGCKLERSVKQDYLHNIISPNKTGQKKSFRKSVQACSTSKDEQKEISDDEYNIAVCPKCKVVGSNGIYAKVVHDNGEKNSDDSVKRKKLSEMIGSYLEVSNPDEEQVQAHEKEVVYEDLPDRR